jgi:metallo-beta-lactamase class B
MPTRLVVSSILACSCVAAVLAQYAPYEPGWNKPGTPHRIVGTIHYVGTTELAVYLIATPKGHILIDTGFEETVPIVRDSIRALGFRYEDIRVLLNTQAHYDHAAGLARVKRETGARLAAMREDAVLLEAGGKNDFRFGDELAFAPVKVDRVLADGDRVELGGVTLIARHTPGHTKGATTFVTTMEEGGRSQTVVFATSVTVNPGTSLVNNAKYPSIVEDWEQTYAVLKSLRPDVWLSAHAGAFDMAGKLQRRGAGQNPYVDPAGYRRFVEGGEQKFRALLAEQRQRRSR